MMPTMKTLPAREGTLATSSSGVPSAAPRAPSAVRGPSVQLDGPRGSAQGSLLVSGSAHLLERTREDTLRSTRMISVNERDPAISAAVGNSNVVCALARG
jgi:hypothetical protein